MISIVLQTMVAESQIAYVTDTEVVGLKQFHYRRVLYYDIMGKGEDEVKKAHLYLRYINFGICAFTALLLIPRYWHNLKILKASHRLPEGSNLLNTAEILTWLLLEMVIALIHSPPFGIIPFKVLTFENTVSFDDKYGRPQVREEKTEYTYDSLITFASILKVYLVLRVILHLSLSSKVMHLVARKMEFRIQFWYVFRSNILQKPFTVLVFCFLVFLPLIATMMRLAELPYIDVSDRER